MRQYRRGARFIADPRQHCRPLDRNERAKIIFMAEQLERRSRPTGGRNGIVSQVGLRVLRALLLRFHRASDGHCTPSYVELMAATGLCKQSIANGLKRLEAVGILKITRRLIRETIDAGGFPMAICRQGSNLYAVFAPAEDADRLSVRAPAGRPFPIAKLSGLAKMFGWKPSLPARGNNTFGFQYRSKTGETDILSVAA